MSRNRPVVIVGAAALPLLLTSLMAIFRNSLPLTTSVLVLVLVVVAVAATGDRSAGVVAALSSGASFDFFFTKPYGNFAISDSADIQAAVLLFVVGLGVTELALWGRRQQARGSRSAGYLEGVIGTAKLISGDLGSPEELTQQVGRQIVEVLGIDTCRFIPGPGPGPNVAVLHHDRQIARPGHRADLERDGFPIDQEVALIVKQGGVIYGHFVLTSPSRIARPTPEQLGVAVLLSDQVGAALTNRPN